MLADSVTEVQDAAQIPTLLTAEEGTRAMRQNKCKGHGMGKCGGLGAKGLGSSL